jgi:signal transduction histidine kinase
MSHELRTPLNAIGGYAELLELGIRGPINDAQRHDLERIRASQQHLLGLISGVLDMSRIEAGRVAYDLEPTLVGPFLDEIVGLVAPLAATKTVSLEHAAGAPGLAVLADREKLRQILLNLLSNAIRHTPPTGRITIAARERGDVVALVTRDTGAGIPADALERIFEPFVQLDRSLTRVREGIGLGLSISRDLARGMGGEIDVESTPGEGACFTLTLPRAIVGAEEEEAVAMRSEEEEEGAAS